MDLGAGWPGAVAMLNKGWPEGSRAVQAAAKRIGKTLPPVVPANTPAASVVGDYLNVPEFLAGTPDHWRRFEPDNPREHRPRIIRLLVNCTANCGTDADVLARRGAAFMALVVRLELAGWRVQLWAGLKMTSIDGRGYYAGMVLVKRAEQHIDPDRLAFIVTHPAAFRRFGFRLYEHHYQSNKALAASVDGGGYGSSQNPPDSLLAGFDLYSRRLEENAGLWEEDEDAARAVREIAERAGYL